MPITVEEAYQELLRYKTEDNLTDSQLLGALYLMFKDDNITLDELEALVDKLGYELTEEFKNMSPEDQKTKGLEFYDDRPFEYLSPNVTIEKEIKIHKPNLKINLGLDYEISEYYMYHILCMYLNTSPYLFVQDDIQKLFTGDIKKLSKDTLKILKRDSRIFDNIVAMVKMYDSERTYKSFTEYELQFLPPLPGKENLEYEKENYSWDGSKWCIYKDE